MPRVGYVVSTTPVSQLAGFEPIHPFFRDFIRALRTLGWVEGQNLLLERRSAEDRFERFDDILNELVGLKCDVIVTSGTAMARAAKRVTTSVPIVISASRPVELGFVASSSASAWPCSKEAVPKIIRVAVLTLRATWEGPYGHEQRVGAQLLGLKLLHAEPAPNDLGPAFALITRERPDGIMVGPDSSLYAHRHRMIAFAVQSRLPFMGRDRDFTEGGALLSYAWSPSILARADRVIE
jgi:putative ABC transport system substrate-binding protein